MISTEDILKRAKKAKESAFSITAEMKNNALMHMADELRKSTDVILNANLQDVTLAKVNGMDDVKIDRLSLNEKRIEDMAKGIEDVATLPDPVGKILSREERDNGLVIEKVSVPLGVVAMIYESRPNVTSDAAALIIKSGNVCILRGGKEAFNSSYEIVKALQRGLKRAELPEDLVLIIEDISRESANTLMKADGYVDLLIPRGGAGLIQTCVENATVPCIQTGTGICHIYVDESADLEKAVNIIENAKMSRPSVCNAQEVCLVNRDIAARFLPMLKKRIVNERADNGLVPCELRLDKEASLLINGVPAGEKDFDTEFLNYILAIHIVKDVNEAISHIEEHSTHHSDAIVTENNENAHYFTNAVDSAAVYVNASTRFTDGGEFGFGCEIGISTQKLHARGPMGLKELNTYKYIIHGNGQVR